MSSQAQIIMAPQRPNITHKYTIFLAGTTSKTGEPDWRQSLIDTISHQPVTVFNPLRTDWDATWREDYSDPRWVEQVEWELEMLDKANLIVVFFHGVSPAPISLLEFGLWAREGKAIACAMKDYSKRGNVMAVCRKYGAMFVETEDELRLQIGRKIDEQVTGCDQE